VLEVTITEGPKKGVVFYVIDDAALRPSPSPTPAEANALPGSFVAPVEIPDETKAELDGDLDGEGGFAASSSLQAVRVGGQIKEPKKLHHVDAIYPRLARASRVQGTVALECVISPLGRVMDVTVGRQHPAARLSGGRSRQAVAVRPHATERCSRSGHHDGHGKVQDLVRVKSLLRRQVTGSDHRPNPPNRRRLFELPYRRSTGSGFLLLEVVVLEVLRERLRG
jgi:hypothetical protein